VWLKLKEGKVNKSKRGKIVMKTLFCIIEQQKESEQQLIRQELFHRRSALC